MKTKTLNRFFLEIFGKDNENMVVFITPEILEDFESTTKNFLKEQAKDMISRKIYLALKNSEGERLEIIKKSMEETPFNYYFQLILDFRSKKCSKPGDHLYYFLYTDRDMYESESFYKCLYCGERKEDSKRSQLMGKFVKCNVYQPHEKFEEGKKLLMELIKKNSKEEIKKLARLIVDLAI